MSNIDSFMAAVENDRYLQAQIKAVNTPEEIVKIARNNNYVFSVQELKATVIERMGLFSLFLTIK